MKAGSKHLIQCHCILPQYRQRQDPPFHKFIVFGETDKDDLFVKKYVQCNNCGAIHKIIDFCKSEIMIGKDEFSMVLKKQDIIPTLPSSLVELFQSYDLDVADYECARFIIDNEQWNQSIVLQKEVEEGITTGKRLIFVSGERFKVNPFSYSEELA